MKRRRTSVRRRFSRPLRIALLVILSVLCGRAGLAADGAAADTISQVIALVSPDSIRAYVTGLESFGTRYYANANRAAVANWIKSRFQMFGPANAELDSFLYSGAQQYNVVATIAGRVVPEKEIIAGGHHDSYSSNLLAAPGADDNASGTAAALEMARVLQAWGYMPASTLRFITFAAEEAGLRGSGDYSARARVANREITAMLNFDMIGHRLSAQGDRDVYLVWYTGAETLAHLDSQMTRQYTTLTPVLTTSYRSGSDSYRFWERGYPAVFSIERDFSPFYHSPQDISDTLDFEYAAEIVRAGLATVLYLDREARPVAVPVPPVFSLAQNFPNPFNPGTSIGYSLATQERVTLTVYDVLGRQVAVLVDGEMGAGPHTARWDASDTASGMYVCRLTTGDRVESIKMVRMQ